MLTTTTSLPHLLMQPPLGDRILPELSARDSIRLSGVNRACRALCAEYWPQQNLNNPEEVHFPSQLDSENSEARQQALQRVSQWMAQQLRQIQLDPHNPHCAAIKQNLSVNRLSCWTIEDVSTNVYIDRILEHYNDLLEKLQSLPKEFFCALYDSNSILFNWANKNSDNRFAKQMQSIQGTESFVPINDRWNDIDQTIKACERSLETPIKINLKEINFKEKIDFAWPFAQSAVLLQFGLISACVAFAFSSRDGALDTNGNWTMYLSWMGALAIFTVFGLHFTYLINDINQSHEFPRVQEYFDEMLKNTKEAFIEIKDSMNDLITLSNGLNAHVELAHVELGNEALQNAAPELLQRLERTKQIDMNQVTQVACLKTIAMQVMKLRDKFSKLIPDGQKLKENENVTNVTALA